MSDKWQPIETVPKTGEDVILGHGNSVWVDHWILYFSTSDAGYWSECGEGETPTHWMPLPDPPPLREKPKDGGNPDVV